MGEGLICSIHRQLWCGSFVLQNSINLQMSFSCQEIQDIINNHINILISKIKLLDIYVTDFVFHSQPVYCVGTLIRQE